MRLKFRIVLKNVYQHKNDKYGIIWTAQDGTLEEAKERARQMWKSNFLRRTKKLIIMQYHGEGKNDYDIVFQHDNISRVIEQDNKIKDEHA